MTLTLRPIDLRGQPASLLLIQSSDTNSQPFGKRGGILLLETPTRKPNRRLPITSEAFSLMLDFPFSATSNLRQLTKELSHGDSPGPVGRAKGTIGGHYDAFGVAVLD